MVFDIMSCLFDLYLHGNFSEANAEIQLTLTFFETGHCNQKTKAYGLNFLLLNQL